MQTIKSLFSLSQRREERDAEHVRDSPQQRSKEVAPDANSMQDMGKDDGRFQHIDLIKFGTEVPFSERMNCNLKTEISKLMRTLLSTLSIKLSVFLSCPLP